MDKAKKEAIMNARTFDELLDAEYGKPGTHTRDQFVADAAVFCRDETQKEERLRDGQTHTQTSTSTLDFLKTHESSEPSRFVEKANKRQENRKTLMQYRKSVLDIVDKMQDSFGRRQRNGGQ